MVNLQSKRNNFRLQLLSLVLMGLSFSLNSQSNLYMFNKALEKDAEAITPFAIVNEGTKTLRALQSNQILVKTISKEWIYITSTPRKIAELKRDGSIKEFHFEFSSPVFMNDSARQKHFVNQVHAGSNGLPMAYTGKDVVIGYIDDGLDFDHPDFKDANNKTRVLKYWDQRNEADITRIPADYGYGQIYDSSDINAGIFLVAGTPNHGTTVTGAGSGNGRATGANKGMSPDSKIIFIKTDESANNWTLTVSDACDYIFKQADLLGLPAVINISVGSYFGSHDGTDPATVLMNSLLDQKSGRIIVAAAGNGGNYGNFHVHGNIDADTSFVWMKADTLPEGFGKNTAFFDLWSEMTSMQNVNFAFGVNKPDGTFESRGSTIFRNVATSFAGLIKDTIFSPAGDTLARLEIYAGIQNGIYNMFVLFTKIDSVDYNYSFKTVGTGSYDMWTGANYGSYKFIDVVPNAATFPSIVNYHMPDSLQSIVSDWNCSEKIVSVGNIQNRIGYIDLDGNPQTFSASFARSGELAYTSSIGPTRINKLKPDIVAAGDGSLSAGSLVFMSITSLNSFIDSSGWFVRNGGTSMSSPVVAGIGGLFLEKCPTSSYGDFINLLHSTSYTDGFTGVVPNIAYGYGKVNALDLMLESCTLGLNESKKEMPILIYPNPSENHVNILGLEQGSKIQLYDMNGKKVKTQMIQYNILDISPLEMGIYHLRIEQNNQILNIKIERL